MPLLDAILDSELRRRCLKRDQIEIEPVLWSGSGTLPPGFTTTPGGIFYILDKAYGIEMGVTKLSGSYSLRSARTPITLSYRNVQHGTPAAGVLGQAAMWTFDHPTIHDGDLSIDVAGVFAGATWTLNLQMLVVHEREEGCDKCQ